jgi:prepilin-type N-terminal cleavage/methylation domain-containing protein
MPMMLTNSLRSGSFRPHRACLDGETDGVLRRRTNGVFDPTPLVGVGEGDSLSVSSVSGVPRDRATSARQGAILFTTQTSWMGPFTRGGRAASTPSRSPCAKGGWGPRQEARRGVTLVELLIVIVIMLMVTAVVVRATAPALSGRRIREAARMVDVFVNGARSRALQTGRPYGVMIERTPVLNAGTGLMNSSMGLSVAYAEVPPPYTGDFTGSRILLLGNGAFGAWQMPLLGNPAPWTLSESAAIAFVSADSVFPSSDSGWFETVSPGDILVIHGTQYRLYAGEPFIDTAPFNGVYDLGEPFADCDMNGFYSPMAPNLIDPVTGFFTTGPTPGSVGTPGTATWTYIYADFAQAAKYMSTATGLARQSMPPIMFPPAATQDNTLNGILTGPQPQYTFQINRRPIKAAGTDQQLPDGAAIDLGGFDLTGNTTLANVVPGSGLDIFSSTPSVPPYLATFRPNPNYQSNPALANFVTDGSPVIITFAPNGVVDKVFSWDERNYTMPTGWQGRQPTSQIFLLVTRRELVGGDLTVTTPSAVTPQYGIQDLTSLWVTINPQTGLINTAPNGALGAALFAGSPPPYYLQCYEARQPARQTQNVGGR